MAAIMGAAHAVTAESMEKFYIGLSTTYHDPAIAVVNSDGEIIFAEASERMIQYKRAFSCPADHREIVRKIISEFCNPKAEFVIAKSWSREIYRLMNLMAFLGLANHEQIPRRPSSMTKFLVSKDTFFSEIWLQQISLGLSGGNLADILRTEFGNEKVSFVKFPHHHAHAANACFTSPFEEAACIIVDGQGEGGSLSYFGYQNGRLNPIRQIKGEASLGILYSVCTELCGFSPEKGEEWKVMGLAPYGELDPEMHSQFKKLLCVKGLGIHYRSLRQIKNWFAYMKTKARRPGEPALSVANMAYTLQFFFSEVMDELLNNFHALANSDNLALGGGAGLNSSYNGQIVSRTKFKQLHLPCAPADDGNAVGAALLAYYQDHPGERPRATLQTPYLGSLISRQSLRNLVHFGGLPKVRHLPKTICQETARLLSEGKLVGWAQGRAEFGPRSLGNRSILADPRPKEMKDRINASVKFREEFRPFAPAILDEFGEQYFENYQRSPYMERTLALKETVREKIPAIVHIDCTGRLQSVRRDWNPMFYDLIASFHELTGVPMLLNTSFNIMGKPIIHSVEDALGLFCTTGLEVLVIDDYLIEK